MGLGGMLTWTAAAREIYEKNSLAAIGAHVIPCSYDGAGNISEISDSPIFLNNPYLFKRGMDLSPGCIQMPMNIPETNYCKFDSPAKNVHRADRHIIEQICEHYGILSPRLKCDLFFSPEEQDKVSNLAEGLPQKFITIEPGSKQSWTPNRTYPLGKWQRVVNALKKDIPIVQLGSDPSLRLDNVISLIGKTTFREAALLIGASRLFISTEGGLVHAATAVNTTSVCIITGYQSLTMVGYPQNINIDIGRHGPCGLKVRCEKCADDASSHNENEIISAARRFLGEDLY